ARGQAGAIFHGEWGRIDLPRIHQKLLLDVEAFSPASGIADFPAENLEQHFREPILARVQDREYDVRQRTSAVLDERVATAPQRAVDHRVGRAGGAAADRDALLP